LSFLFLFLTIASHTLYNELVYIVVERKKDMKTNQIDKNKAKIAAVVSILALGLESILGMAFSFTYYLVSGSGLIARIMYVVIDIFYSMAVFMAGYSITTKFIFKGGAVKTKECAEMGLTVALVITAFQRLLNMMGIYTMLSMIIIIGILFAGAYFLVPEKGQATEDGGSLMIGQQTVYRKEKVVQKGSKAEGLLNYVFLYAWGAGIIFTWGGFIVRPRSQAPAFYAIGIVCLILAAYWTYAKIDAVNIERYKKIILPDYWPKDCSYEKYHLGLHSKGAKTSGGLFGDKNMKFYQECRSNNIFDLDSEYNMQKALKIGEKQNIKDISEEKLKEMYLKGKEMTETDAKVASETGQMNLLNDKRIEELNILADQLRFYGHHGIEKRKVMLRSLMKEADKKRKDAEMMANMAGRTMLQKEHDWATHGGIASGIAGPAAGVATALDIQAKNAVIREQNAKMMPYVAMVSGSYTKTAQGYQQEYNRYAADLQATNTKLVSPDSKEDVMKHIVIKDAKYTVSKTGAVTVTANFSVDGNYRIFESTKPTIDGCVACRIMQGETCVGSAYFVFPVEGIITPTTLNAICTKTTDPKGEYTLVFEPDDVWAMEKL